MREKSLQAVAEIESTCLQTETNPLHLQHKAPIDTLKNATVESCDLKDEEEESPGLQAVAIEIE
jgi:hypothetical protein